jgi:hypothetical protein
LGGYFFCSGFKLFPPSEYLGLSRMGHHFQFKGMGSADVHHALDGIVLGVGFVFAFAFHFPGVGDGGDFFESVFLHPQQDIFLIPFLNVVELGHEQNIVDRHTAVLLSCEVG